MSDDTQRVTAQREATELAKLLHQKKLALAREIQQILAGPLRSLSSEQHLLRRPICDVMGHGVRSALVVAMLRGLIGKQRALSLEHGPFLQGLNESISAILERAYTTRFKTVFLALLDFVADTFHCACASHP